MYDNISIDNIKPKIDYPCVWSYRVIGFSKELVLEVIEKVFDNKADVSPIEHVSSHGKYVAINCSIEVKDDCERLAYFDGLTKQHGIVMVI